jgi:hypothetical protein
LKLIHKLNSIFLRLVTHKVYFQSGAFHDCTPRLRGGSGGSSNKQITLTEGGSYLGSQSNPFLSAFDTTIWLVAEFAFPVANQKPNSGVYSSNLILAVKPIDQYWT